LTLLVARLLEGILTSRYTVSFVAIHEKMPPKSLKKKKSRRIKTALPIHPQDLHALRSIFESTGGPFGWKVKVNWMTAAPLEEWTGILVDEDTGRVTELWLRANGLTQTVPDALGLLSELQVLDLGENPGLVGPVPAALGNLLHLRVLMLDDCQLDTPLTSSPEPSLRCSNRDEVLALFKSVGGTIMAKVREVIRSSLTTNAQHNSKPHS
jgi:hypothetical protein